MAVKELIRDSNILGERAKEWDVRGNQNLSTEIVQSLDDTINAHPELLFLASNEVGYKERAIDVRFSDDTYIFMNPILQKTERLAFAREIDRIDGKEYIVPRFGYIELVYQDCLGSIKAAKFENAAALIICQALDTLDGIFSSEIGLEVLPEFDQATPEEQKEVLDAYMNSLNMRYNELDKELQLEDDKVRNQWNAIKFMIAKSEGKIQGDEEKPLSKRKQKLITKLAKQIKQNQNKLKFWRRKKDNES